MVEGIVEEELGRKAGISEVQERVGTAGMVLIVRMEKLKDKEDLIGRGWEIRRN